MEHIDEQDDLDWGEEVDQCLTDDAVPLCPGCLRPCHPLSSYCTNCGCNEPVNPLAAYMPYVNLRFQWGMIGKLWRRTWFHRIPVAQRILNIALLIVCVPAFVVLGLFFLIWERLCARSHFITS
jgi:hypothetical protein